MYKLEIPIAYNIGDKKWFMFENKPVQGSIRCVIIPTITVKAKFNKEGNELVNPDIHISYEVVSLNGVYLCDKKSYELFNTKEACVKSLL